MARIHDEVVVERMVAGPPELIRKDHEMMSGLTPTNCQVNDFRLRENLAKAEHHHCLTRADVAPQRRARRSTFLVRLAQMVFGSVRTTAPQR